MFRFGSASRIPILIAATLAFGVATALGPMRVVESRLATGACADATECASAAPDFLPRSTGELRLPAETRADGLRLLLWIALAFSILLVAGVAVNLATLGFARASARRPEITLRSALGAAPWRLTGDLLREALRVALSGVLAGAALGAAGAIVLAATWPVDGAGRLGTGGAGMAYRVAPAALTAVVLLAWLAPARPAWARDLRRWLAVGRGAVGPMGTRGRDLLVVLQIAASLLLLASAGMLLRGYGPWRATVAATTVDPDDGFVAQVRLGGRAAATTLGRMAAYERILERVRALPEVVDTSLATEGAWLGLGVQDRVTALCVECYLGQDPKQMTSGSANIHAVGPGYFAASGIRILEGREFAAGDRPGAEAVAIISRMFAYRLFPNGEPLGKEIRFGGLDGDWFRVIGVVDDVVAPSPGSPGMPLPAVYLAVLQHPPAAASVLVRTSPRGPDAAAIVAAVEGGAGNGSVVTAAARLQQRFDEARAPLRWFALLLGGLAAALLVVALGGLYELMSYGVALRTREIGLRMAVGAREASVIAMVVLRSGRLVALGVVAGMIPLSGVGRLLQTSLAGVDPWDLPMTGAVAALLALVALLASVGPARRAARLEPQAALREE